MNNVKKTAAALLAVVSMTCSAGSSSRMAADEEVGCLASSYRDVPSTTTTALGPRAINAAGVDRLGTGTYRLSLVSADVSRTPGITGSTYDQFSSRMERFGQNIASTPIVQKLISKGGGIIRLDGGNEPPTSLLLVAAAAVMLYVARRRRSN